MGQPGVRTGRFRAADRLLDTRDYRRVMRRGRRFACRDLVVIVAPRPVQDRAQGRGMEQRVDEKLIGNNELEFNTGNRLGITISRKVGHAVCRNRFKRRVRAWFREHRGKLGREVDLIVMARKPAGQLDSAELDERLSQLLGLRQTTQAQTSK